MASSLIAMPFRPVLNQKGEFESGAIMTVYKQGTSTLEPLYADAALTIPLTNPVIADSFGVYPPVYFNEDQTLRVIIQDSTGATLFDLDPYISTAFDAESILDAATEQANFAAASASEARDSADICAASEGVVEGLVGPTYASTAAGLADTSDGDFFAVLNGTLVEIYLNDAGIAVFQRDVLSGTAAEAALANKSDVGHVHVIANVTGLQTALDAKAPLASPSFSGTPDVGGIELGYRSIPRSTTSGTATADDNGKCVAASADLTIPSAVFSAGDAVTVYNDSASDILIVEGAGLTLRQAATVNTGNRTLAARGMCTMWFNGASEAIISGPGLT